MYRISYLYKIALKKYFNYISVIKTKFNSTTPHSTLQITLLLYLNNILNWILLIISLPLQIFYPHNHIIFLHSLLRPIPLPIKISIPTITSYFYIHYYNHLTSTPDSLSPTFTSYFYIHYHETSFPYQYSYLLLYHYFHTPIIRIYTPTTTITKFPYLLSCPFPCIQPRQLRIIYIYIHFKPVFILYISHLLLLFFDMNMFI